MQESLFHCVYRQQSDRRSTRVWLLRLFILCAVLSSIFALTPAAPPVHADGGAPNLAYVAGGGQGVSIIDIAQQKITASIALGGDPAMLYLTLDGRYLYVAQPGLDRVSILNTSTDETICSVSVPGQPSLMAFDAGVNLLYVAGNGAASITALKADTCTIQKTIATSGPVYGLAAAEVGSGPNGGTGNQLWFTTSAGLNVYTLPDKIQHIAVAGNPQYISIPPGATVYATTRQGTVVAINLQNLSVTASLLSGGDFGPMDFDAFTSEVYVPDKQHHRIDVLTPIFYGSGIPHEPNHVIDLDVSPQSVAVTADGNLGFFALTGGNVAMFDIPGKQLSNTFFVGGIPRFIITGLYPPVTRNSSQNNANGSPLPTSTLILLAIVALLLLIGIITLLILTRRKRG
jgi:YVTN family beta-propeller protein